MSGGNAFSMFFTIMISICLFFAASTAGLSAEDPPAANQDKTSVEQPEKKDGPGQGMAANEPPPPGQPSTHVEQPEKKDQADAGMMTKEPVPAEQYKVPIEQPERNDRSGGGLITKGEMLTLSRCIDIALRINPTIVAAVNTVDVNRSRVGESRSAYYPQISTSAQYTNNRPATATLFGARYDQYTGSVTLNQTIYDFGKTSSSVDVSKYNLASARSDLNTTQDTISLSVKQAYYGVLQARRNRDVAADVIKQFQLHLDQAQGFYEVGTKSKIDVIKAEVDLSTAKLSLINAENALKIAWVTLNNTMGVPDAPEYAIEDNLSFQPYTVTLEEATGKAFENRPDLKSIIAKRQAAEANISLARSGYYPTLSGSASYNKAGVDVPPNQLDGGWNAGVVLTVPLFSGFLTSHQVAEAKSNLYVLKANEESIRQQILLEVRQAYLNLQAAEASISTAELAARQAKENLDLANGRYSAGVGSPIEVSDAFATYVTAQANYTSALSNYKIAQASIERAMGAR
ncbi:MAG TPA: TolC family protein [Nitrospirota bacterium]|nr:TolC family protein [Nitrospirota bacterium]